MKDQAHYTTMSFSSALKVLNQMIIAKELNYIKDSDLLKEREKISKITNMLNALRKSQINRKIIKQINE